MASSRRYLGFVPDQLSSLQDVSCRAMMGEYILYYRGKLVGGAYDDRLMVEAAASAGCWLCRGPGSGGAGSRVCSAGS